MDSTGSSTALFEPERLEIARKLQGLRKKELAELVHVSPAAITQYEGGRVRPSPPVLARISLALGFPIEFFGAGRPVSGLDPSTTHFRSLRSTRQLERDSALARAELTWELAQLLERYVRLPVVDLPELPFIDAPTGADIERLAMLLRAAWAVPVGPIASVVRLLETHGVIVTRLVSGLERVDAFSRWFGDRPVVVLYADKRDAARSRFDAAHELAHLLMHHDAEPGEGKAEREAHVFAAAFLLPADQIRAQLPSRLDWPRLVHLKQVWGVSLAALLYRSRSLGVMSDSTYRRAMSVMSKNGWRRQEPGALGEPESPALFARALHLLAGQGIGVDEVASELRLPGERVREVAALDEDRPPVFPSSDLTVGGQLD